jgi:hypothetical protein
MKSEIYQQISPLARSFRAPSALSDSELELTPSAQNVNEQFALPPRSFNDNRDRNSNRRTGNKNDGFYYPDFTGRYIHDNRGQYIHDNRGLYVHIPGPDGPPALPYDHIIGPEGGVGGFGGVGDGGELGEMKKLVTSTMILIRFKAALAQEDQEGQEDLKVSCRQGNIAS